MTYNVLSGTLNPTIPYHTKPMHCPFQATAAVQSFLSKWRTQACSLPSCDVISHASYR